MKEKILNHPLIRWIIHLPVCRWAASNPILSRFCTYEVISYLICGVLTTAVDYVTYFIGKGIGLNTAAATTLAWVLAVLFAYFSNKAFVFLSTDWSAAGIRRELFPFISCRILSYLMNVVIMVITVDRLCWNEPFMKIASNILVMIVNYFGSKLFVFRRQKGGSHEN